MSKPRRHVHRPVSLGYRHSNDASSLGFKTWWRSEWVDWCEVCGAVREYAEGTNSAGEWERVGRWKKPSQEER